MGSDLFYSSGQTARELGTTQTRIRALCESGAIEATSTPGGQWRVPREEVERLQAEGLPSLARPLPEPPTATSPGSRPKRRRDGVTLLAEPSQDAIDSAEEVLRLENEIKAIELRKQREEALDWFRQRTAREAERHSAQQLHDQQERAKKDAERQHEVWLTSWERYALSRLQALAYDSSPEVRLDLHNAVRMRLASLQPPPASDVTQKLVDAEIEKASEVWRGHKESTGAIEYAMRRLPWDVQHNSDFAPLKQSALKAAAEAVNNSPDSDRRTKEGLAGRAVQTFADQYEHVDRISRIVRGLASLVPGASAGELHQATASVAEALAQSPIGTDKAGIEKIRDTVLAPIRDQVTQRQRQEEEKLLREKQARALEEEAARRKREALERQSSAERRVDRKLVRVDICLGELERKKRIVFDGFSERWEIGQKLKSKIREILVQQIVEDPQISEEKVRQRIDALTIKHVVDFTD